MKLFLVRHGTALSKEADPSRPLSEHGKADVRRMARYLAELNIRISDIRHSTKLRAAQTAGILASKVATGTDVTEVEGLAPDDPVEPVAGEIRSRDQDLMLVGHLPFLHKLAGYLLGSLADPLLCPTASVLILSRTEDGVWSVESQIRPQDLES